MRWSWMILFLTSICAQAQDAPPDTQDPPWYVGTRAHFGFLWPHRPVAWYLVEGHATAFEVYGERRFKSDRSWQRHYRGAGYGLGLLYSGMANPEVIGGGVRLIPYLQIPFIQGEKGALGMRLGWGVGYVFKPFDRTENTKQIATGTRINTAIQLMLEYRVDLQRVRLSTGASIDHMSNGAVSLPNLGLNLLSMNVGVAYALAKPVAPVTSVDTIPFNRRAREQSVTGAFGISETARPRSGQFTTYSVIGHVQWNVTPKSSFGGGFDVFNKGTMRTDHPQLLEEGRMAFTQVGVHGGWALGFGRGELLLQMGAYAYTPYPDESIFYHRLGMRYRLGDRWLAHLSLKSHWAVADHWEWGLGYRWH